MPRHPLTYLASAFGDPLSPPTGHEPPNVLHDQAANILTTPCSHCGLPTPNPPPETTEPKQTSHEPHSIDREYCIRCLVPLCSSNGLQEWNSDLCRRCWIVCDNFGALTTGRGGNVGYVPHNTSAEVNGEKSREAVDKIDGLRLPPPQQRDHSLVLPPVLVSDRFWQRTPLEFWADEHSTVMDTEGEMAAWWQDQLLEYIDSKNASERASGKYETEWRRKVGDAVTEVLFRTVPQRRLVRGEVGKWVRRYGKGGEGGKTGKRRGGQRNESESESESEEDLEDLPRRKLSLRGFLAKMGKRLAEEEGDAGRREKGVMGEESGDRGEGLLKKERWSWARDWLGRKAEMRREREVGGIDEKKFLDNDWDSSDGSSKTSSELI